MIYRWEIYFYCLMGGMVQGIDMLFHGNGFVGELDKVNTTVHTLTSV